MQWSPVLTQEDGIQQLVAIVDEEGPLNQEQETKEDDAHEASGHGVAMAIVLAGDTGDIRVHETT